MAIKFDPDRHASQPKSERAHFQSILKRVNKTMQHDRVVQSTTDELRSFLQVDRVVLYYFYTEWAGQVTFESLSDQKFSIFGSTGPDDCFNEEYAQLYLEGRVRAIEDIETADIAPCHRDFLRKDQVKANLVVPILTDQGLWGLLVAHNCQSTKSWSKTDITEMQKGAAVLSEASSIKRNQ